MFCLLPALSAMPLCAQTAAWPDATEQQTYTPHRASSTDPKGCNQDFRRVAPGATLTVLDVEGLGAIAHIWFTIADNESYHLSRIVLRIYWDGQASPSVQTPVGDFLGLGLGEYHSWQSELLSVASDKSLNSFFTMPFRQHARITITNERDSFTRQSTGTRPSDAPGPSRDNRNSTSKFQFHYESSPGTVSATA
jgi:hypothetical protein